MVVNVSHDPYGPGSSALSVSDLRETALGYGKAHFAGNTYTNLETGSGILVGTRGLKHTTHAAYRQLALALSCLPLALETSTLTGIAPDKRSRPELVRVLKYTVEFQVEDRLRDGLIVVFEVRGPGGAPTQQFYDLSFAKE